VLAKRIGKDRPTCHRRGFTAFQLVDNEAAIFVRGRCERRYRMGAARVTRSREQVLAACRRLPHGDGRHNGSGTRANCDGCKRHGCRRATGPDAGAGGPRARRTGAKPGHAPGRGNGNCFGIALGQSRVRKPPMCCRPAAAQVRAQAERRARCADVSQQGLPRAQDSGPNRTASVAPHIVRRFPKASAKHLPRPALRHASQMPYAPAPSHKPKKVDYKPVIRRDTGHRWACVPDSWTVSPTRL
jgi:hypothetical protein